MLPDLADHHNLDYYCSSCVGMGSMGSAESMEFQRRVPEPMDFEQIVR